MHKKSAKNNWVFKGGAKGFSFLLFIGLAVFPCVRKQSSADQETEKILARCRARKESMDIKKLFALADRAKTIREGQNYALPNAVFCVLLDALFKGDEDAQGLEVELETQDCDGSCAKEAFYDLFVLRLPDGESLCIPASLLCTETAMALTKRATICAREEHGRVMERGRLTEYFELWDELEGAWGPSPIYPYSLEEAVSNHLTDVAAHCGGLLR